MKIKPPHRFGKLFGEIPSKDYLISIERYWNQWSPKNVFWWEKGGKQKCISVCLIDRVATIKTLVDIERSPEFESWMTKVE